MTEYISKAQYRADKSRLTRAQNSGDPVKILDAVEKTLDGWEGKAWPDDWHRWNRAVGDLLWRVDDDLLPRVHELQNRMR